MASFHREFSDVTQNDLAKIRSFVEQAVSRLGASEEEVGELVLAANEASANIIIHGYRSRPGKITIDIEMKGGAVLLRIYDDSPPFDPRVVPAPDITLPLEQRSPGGMGVHMIRSFTDEIHYVSSKEGENELTMIKVLLSSTEQ